MRLLVAEVKEISPARYGHKAVVKHIPDVAFSVAGTLYQRIGMRFAPELALWSGSAGVHLIVVATVCLGPEGLPHIAELSLMTVTEHWLPVETMAEVQKVIELIRDRRSFAKLLRYDLRPDAHIPSLILTDEPDSARASNSTFPP